MVPISGNTHPAPVEVRSGHRIQCKGQPVSKHHHPEDDPLHLHRAESKKEQEDVTQADLRQRVLEGPVGLRPADRADPHAEEHERERAPDSMAQHRTERTSFRLPAGDRERQSHADEERERRLDQVVQRAADPRDMALMMAEERPEAAVRQGGGHAAEVQHLPQHQEHDEPTIGVDGGKADGRIAGGDFGVHAVGFFRASKAGPPEGSGACTPY